MLGHGCDHNITILPGVAGFQLRRTTPLLVLRDANLAQGNRLCNKGLRATHEGEKVTGRTVRAVV